jgi:hypothetical protein
MVWLATWPRHSPVMIAWPPRIARHLFGDAHHNAAHN